MVDKTLTFDQSVDCLVTVLHGLLIGYRDATFSNDAFDAIAGAFETVLDFAGTQSTLIAGESLTEAFLGYTLRFITTCQLRTDQVSFPYIL